VVAEASDGGEARCKAMATRPDVASLALAPAREWRRVDLEMQCAAKMQRRNGRGNEQLPTVARSGPLPVEPRRGNAPIWFLAGGADRRGIGVAWPSSKLRLTGKNPLFGDVDAAPCVGSCAVERSSLTEI
jgi:hypothetical protein